MKRRTFLRSAGQAASTATAATAITHPPMIRPFTKRLYRPALCRCHSNTPRKRLSVLAQTNHVRKNAFAVDTDVL